MKISFSVWKVWTFWTSLSSIFNKVFEFWTKSVYTWVVNNKKINLNFWCPFQYCVARYQEILWANTQKNIVIFQMKNSRSKSHYSVGAHYLEYVSKVHDSTQGQVSCIRPAINGHFWPKINYNPNSTTQLTSILHTLNTWGKSMIPRKAKYPP